MRKSVLVLVAGAVAGAAAAGVIRFKLVPDAERVQGDQLSVTRYAGTASFLDTSALSSGDLTHAFAKDVPFTAVETVKAAGMHGDVAVLSDVTKVSGPAAPALGDGNTTWAVDRKTLMPAAAPAGVAAADHKGLAVGFAFGPGKHDYPWWDGASMTQATAKYQRSETHSGRATYVYTVDVTGALKDPHTVAAVPPAVPAGLLKSLASVVAPDQAAALASILPADDSTPVPLTYSAATKTTMWVDQLDGTTVDADSRETVTAQLSTPLGKVPLTSVLDVDTKMSPEGVADAVKLAKHDASLVLWEGEVLPIGLAVAALLCAGGAVWLQIRGKARREASTQSPQSEPSSPGAAL